MGNHETAQDLFTSLCEPFPAEFIDWRVGSTTSDKKKGMALAYIDARTVMDRLDGICGPDNWQCNYTPGCNGSIICNIGVRMPSGEWIWKADGAGATDVEGEKGMLSDALKRAAVRWGVGRYLYELGSPWVELDEGRNGKAGPIKASERKKLDALHENYAVKAGWGKSATRVAAQLQPPDKRQNPHVTRPDDISDAVIEYDAHGQPIDNIPIVDGERMKRVADMRPVFETLQKSLHSAGSIADLKKWGSDNATVVASLKADWQEILRKLYAEHQAELRKQASGDDMRLAG